MKTQEMPRGAQIFFWAPPCEKSLIRPCVLGPCTAARICGAALRQQFTLPPGDVGLVKLRFKRTNATSRGRHD